MKSKEGDWFRLNILCSLCRVSGTMNYLIQVLSVTAFNNLIRLSCFTGKAYMKCDLCFWSCSCSSSPRSLWLLSLEHSASHSRPSWCHGPGRQMNLGGTMTLFSCRCPHQRGRDGKDLLDHPAHCGQTSVRSGLALYFFVFCPVQTVSIYWISVPPTCLSNAENRGRIVFLGCFFGAHNFRRVKWMELAQVFLESSV